MSYSFIQDVPATEEVYGEIRAKLGDATPPGLIAHLVIKRDAGLRYVDVWASKDDWDRFHDDRLQPVVDEVLAGYGITVDPSLVSREEVDVIDTWIG